MGSLPLAPSGKPQESCGPGLFNLVGRVVQFEGETLGFLALTSSEFRMIISIFFHVRSLEELPFPNLAPKAGANGKTAYSVCDRGAEAVVPSLTAVSAGRGCTQGAASCPQFAIYFYLNFFFFTICYFDHKILRLSKFITCLTLKQLEETEQTLQMKH